MAKVTFFEPGTLEDRLLEFAVIAARYEEHWVFVRHRCRDTWEIPGGHREPGETVEEAARRELWEDETMAVKVNENKEIVADIREGLKRTGGYCPCRLERTEENKCICQEFKEQIADPEFEGYCHCMLYYKSRD